jgi:hypothetical protein
MRHRPRRARGGCSAAPARSTSRCERARIQPAATGDPCQPYTPISLGETRSGTLAAGDCGSINGASFLADRYSFTGTAGQQIVVTATGSNGLALSLYLIRDSDGTVVSGGYGSSGVSRLPSSGAFTLPAAGTFLIEVSTSVASTTGPTR